MATTGDTCAQPFSTREHGEDRNRITLEDGTELVASGDHRFLTQRGWKFVTGKREFRSAPYLTLSNELMGVGRFASGPAETDEYRRGYLCGMIRGDGMLGSWPCVGRNGRPSMLHAFRLALVDIEGLVRTRRYLSAVENRDKRFRLSRPAARASA